MVEQLRNDTEGLLTELGDVSARNDELLAAREADARTIRELENQVREWRKKYENAKTELRSIKGNLTLFHTPHLKLTMGHSSHLAALHAETQLLRRQPAHVLLRRHRRHPRHRLPRLDRRAAHRRPV